MSLCPTSIAGVGRAPRPTKWWINYLRMASVKPGGISPIQTTKWWGFIGRCTLAGCAWGRDIDLISCNNDARHLALLDPHLVNIVIQASQIGRAAVEMLLWRMKNPDEAVRRLLIAPALVEGKSN